jgi:hypothetical protein
MLRAGSLRALWLIYAHFEPPFRRRPSRGLSATRHLPLSRDDNKAAWPWKQASQQYLLACVETRDHIVTGAQRFNAMDEATFVAFVPKKKSDELRETLTAEDTGPLRWRERRTFSGSEFYFTGPTELARKAQIYVTQWLISG